MSDNDTLPAWQGPPKLTPPKKQRASTTGGGSIWTGSASGWFGNANAGVLAGIAMMAIAATWFFLGLSANRIFFYPPVLFVIGLVAVGKGLLGG